MDFPKLKNLLANQDATFWTELPTATSHATDLDDLIFLSNLRKKARTLGLPGNPISTTPERVALVGGYSLYPLRELLQHLLAVQGVAIELFIGEFDNQVAEIMEAESPLYRFNPNIIVFLPRARDYPGALNDSHESVRVAAESEAARLLALCQTAHERTKAELIVTNFALPGRHDPGATRGRLASEWSFRKLVNVHLAAHAPPCVRICDVEFLVNRIGALATEDARGWYESKQPGSPVLLINIAREIAHLISSLRLPSRKVLALDLDNTLWGGIIGEDGMTGIELGETSPRGEAFKSFQKHVASLKARGVLLAVCSKNDHDTAVEPFLRHPETVLRREDFVAFKADWNPKPDNLRAIAHELNLGLDAFVFADDNPAEIELVRQSLPEVATLLLGPDPADYVSQLQDCRFFEPHSITTEDIARSEQYRADAARRIQSSTITDMPAYLESLGMTASMSEFTVLDAPRLAQLINKSNQFNLTTLRRTESEVLSLVSRPDISAFSLRLKDRFGDHGLISVVIAVVSDATLEIDTWLMSCRVLQRQVEDVALNELIRRARERGCMRVKGTYIATPRNGMVRDFYARMGFTLVRDDGPRREYSLDVAAFEKRAHKIQVAHNSPKD